MEITIYGARYIASKIPSILCLQILSITHTPIPIEGIQALFSRFKLIPMLNTLDLSRDAISF